MPRTPSTSPQPLSQAQQRLAAQYLPVARSEAAKAFRRCRAALPGNITGREALEELQQVAALAICEAARRFDGTRIGLDSRQPVTFAPFARVWAYRACRARETEEIWWPLLERNEERLGDQPAPGEGSTEDDAPELDQAECAEVRGLLDLPDEAPHRQIAEMWSRGLDDDDVLDALDLGWDALDMLDAVRLDLRGALQDFAGRPTQSPLTLSAAAEALGCATSTLLTRLRKEQVPGACKRAGQWSLPRDLYALRQALGARVAHDLGQMTILGLAPVLSPRRWHFRCSVGVPRPRQRPIAPGQLSLWVVQSVPMVALPDLSAPVGKLRLVA